MLMVLPVRAGTMDSAESEKASAPHMVAVIKPARWIEESKEERLKRLLSFDKELRGKASAVLGVDEVGRGCLAGPVVAGAVILPQIKARSALAKALVELNDSKLLEPEKRERLAAVIRESSIYAVEEASVEEIDDINILQATFLAMKRALLKVQMAAGDLTANAVVAIDGNKTLSGIELYQVPVVKGDFRSASIAAASVVAKVYRDALMVRLAEEHPQYHWQSNKGYAAPNHRRAIMEHGVTRWHRRVFVDSFINVQLELPFPTGEDDESSFAAQDDELAAASKV